MSTSLQENSESKIYITYTLTNIITFHMYGNQLVGIAYILYVVPQLLIFVYTLNICCFKEHHITWRHSFFGKVICHLHILAYGWLMIILNTEVVIG